MTPITQTKFVIKDGSGNFIQRGNCYAACIASIMDLPIIDVPNVETLFDIDDYLWIQVMMSFLESKGWELTTFDKLRYFHLKNFDSIAYFEIMPYVDIPYLVSGKSSRGVLHMCIYKNGELLHDPHPSKEGLLTFENFQILEKIK